VNPRVFREYDIRGVADRDLDDALVADLGVAIAERVCAAGTASRPRVAVGRDMRLTSPRLRDALVGGLGRGGCDIADIGECATPVLYFAAHDLGTEGAVMITGSHNPAEDNGFKVLVGRTTIHGAEIAALRDAIVERREHPRAPRGLATVDHVDVLPAYLERAEASLRLGARRLKVVVDAGNGAGGPAAVALYTNLGFDVVPLHCEPDGRFPNHHPDPTVPENLADLRRAIAESGAEVGIALDGDGDRLGAVDGRGRILWGDQLMILLGKAILEEEGPGARFVGEVKCSQAMYDELTRAGGHAEMWKVGHSLIKARMKETGAALAGEMSGHLFFAHRWLGFDDAVYAGARLLEVLTQGPRTLADLFDELPVMVNTPEIRVDCPDDAKFDVVAKVTARMRAHPDVVSVVDIDGVRARFADGWGLVRASNTQPALVMRCEATDAAALARIVTTLETAIAEAK
jgi:phosphomannomutase/phosphoglucomutase